MHRRSSLDKQNGTLVKKCSTVQCILSTLTLFSLPHLVIYCVKLGEEDAIDGTRVTLLRVVDEGSSWSTASLPTRASPTNRTRSGEFTLISCTERGGWREREGP